MKNTKLNNKGFSFVEFIIVIAIMAVLTGALAPALIKYIARSRRSADVNNANTISTAVTNTINDEDAYSELLTKAGNSNSVSFTIDSANNCIQASDSIGSSFDSILKENISGGFKQMGVKSSKDSSGNSLNASDFTVTINTATSEIKVYIGAIECYPNASAMQ